MPSGKKHEKINLIMVRWLMVFGFFSLLFLQYDSRIVSYVLVFLIGIWFGTYYLSPDLDIKSRPYYRFKWLRFIWKPYQHFFSHRSFWTHGLLIGDIIRMAYLGLFISLPFSLISFSLIEWMKPYTTHFVYGASGIALASTFHIIADTVHSARKKKKR